MKKALIGYQVYSAREDAQKDLLGTLKQIKAMGYDGVEFAGFYGHPAEEVKQFLDEAGIIAISDHVPFALIEKDMFKVISDHLIIGCKYIAVPYLDDSTRPGSAGFGRTLQRIHLFGELCRRAGIQLLYHNHDFEFCTVSGQYGLDFIYDSIPADVLKTEIDCCWVKYSGIDPAGYVRKYAGRCPIVHLKDFVGRKEGDKSPYALISADGEGEAEGGSSEVAFEFRPVGYGCQDIPSIVTAGLESGADWFIVEQDLSVGRTPLEAAKLSVDYLRGIGL